MINISVFYGVIRLLLVKWHFRMVSPRNLSSYHSGGVYLFLAIAGVSYVRFMAMFFVHRTSESAPVPLEIAIPA